MLLRCDRLSKTYHHRTLFSDLSLALDEGERVGVVGPNAAGKSTLLRILAGLETADAGEVVVRRGVRVAYVPQVEEFVAETSAHDTVVAALATIVEDADERAHRARVALSRIEFPDPESPTGKLSGGWRKRLALACALAGGPDALLLDEPTNHLDLDGVLWLEQFLASAGLALLMVSHDRYLLEAVCTRVVEINRAYPSGAYSVAGPYSQFIEKRAAVLSGQETRRDALAGKVRREIEWMMRGRKAQTIKAKARKDEAFRLVDELTDLTDRTNAGAAAGIQFQATGRRSNDLLVATQIARRVGERTLFAGVDVRLAPGDRLGVLGPNGSGKSTLLRVLAGELPPEEGAVKWADGAKIVIFDQHRAALDPAETLTRALAGKGETFEFQGRYIHVAAWAQRFNFDRAQLNTPVGELSGGEQARVQLAGMMRRPADILLLDEPTNDLDLETLDVLTESIEQFAGAVVVISHDRYLLDRVCTGWLALDGRGGARPVSGLASWIQSRGKSADEAAEAKRGASAAAKRDAAEPRRGGDGGRPKKLGYRDQLELDGMEAAIEAAEHALQSAQQAAADPAIASDYTELQKRYETVAAAEKKVAALYARWEELEALRRGSE